MQRWREFVRFLIFAAGTVKVFAAGSTEPKTLTGAEHLIDLVGQPRLANSWWPSAVISEERATATAQRQQQELLVLAAFGAEKAAMTPPQSIRCASRCRR